MEAVPPQDSLGQIQEAQLIKEVIFPSLSALLESYGPPLFEKLIPYSIREAVQEYGKLKEKKQRGLSDSIQDSIGLGKAALSALSLPATLEAFEVPLGLPKSILEKSDDVKKQGGTNCILDLQMTLVTLAKRDKDILFNAQKILLEEEKEDEMLCNRFSTNWTRLPSSKLNENLKNMISNFQNKLARAFESDSIFSKKIDDSLHVIESLCSSREELEALIPSSSPTSTIGAKDPNIKLLRHLIDQLQAVHKAMKEIDDEILSFCKTDSVGKFYFMINIENALLEAYSANTDLSTEPAFEAGIAKYCIFSDKIDKARTIQDSILQKIHETSSKFASISSANRVISEREEAFANLNSAYNSFMDIKSGLISGIQFYNDFEPLLMKLSRNCSDFVFARNIDKKDILDRLQQSFSDMNISASPSRPQPSAPSIEPGEFEFLK